MFFYILCLAVLLPVQPPLTRAEAGKVIESFLVEELAFFVQALVLGLQV